MDGLTGLPGIPGPPGPPGKSGSLVASAQTSSFNKGPSLAGYQYPQAQAAVSLKTSCYKCLYEIACNPCQSLFITVSAL